MSDSGDEGSGRSQGIEEARREAQQGVSPLDRIAGWVSGLLVAAAVAFLVYGAIRPDTPAAFALRADPPRAVPGGFFVPVHVENTGDESVGSVRIRGALLEADHVVEETEGTLQFVPGGSVRSLTLVFRHDPRRYRTVVEVQGFTHL